MKLLAVVIELSGEAKEKSVEAWSELKEKQDIEFISSNSPCPHITLVSGVALEDKVMFDSIVATACDAQTSFQLDSDGLGVFVKDTPIIHTRWKLNKQVVSLRRYINSRLHIEGEYNFLAKSTLGASDTSYEKLEGSLGILSGIEFSSFTWVSGLAVYQYQAGMPEVKLSEFKLK